MSRLTAAPAAPGPRGVPRAAGGQGGALARAAGRRRRGRARPGGVLRGAARDAARGAHRRPLRLVPPDGGAGARRRALPNGRGARVLVCVRAKCGVSAPLSHHGAKDACFVCVYVWRAFGSLWAEACAAVVPVCTHCRTLAADERSRRRSFMTCARLCVCCSHPAPTLTCAHNVQAPAATDLL
jgi:hypothetical protein